MGHKPFNELRAKMSPEAQKRSRDMADQILADMEISELREALNVRQTDLARKLRTTQAAISRLEARPDTKISTLQKYIEALGGKLEVRANLPGRTIRLTHFVQRKRVAKKDGAPDRARSEKHRAKS
jgi:DNA-binding transcriptional regulator YiaG